MTETTPPAATAGTTPASSTPDTTTARKPAVKAPRTAAVGDTLLVTVDPAGNNGHDTAPALVTSVNSDGLVNVLVFRETAANPQLYGELAVFPDRAAVDALHVDHRPAFAAHFAG